MAKMARQMKTMIECVREASRKWCRRRDKQIFELEDARDDVNLCPKISLTDEINTLRRRAKIEYRTQKQESKTRVWNHRAARRRRNVFSSSENLFDVMQQKVTTPVQTVFFGVPSFG